MKIVIATVVLGVVMGVTCAFSTPEKPQSVVQADMKEDKISRQDGKVPALGKRSNEKKTGESLAHDDDEINDHGRLHNSFSQEIEAQLSLESFESDEADKDSGNLNLKSNHHNKNKRRHF
ncbi:uncharacterized protein [Penaeus vannamei]|uniref:uncharacterized protein isoform X1 n=1 Tax=Penaeus vannamei TaxID=6689 RepID=UPI00387F7E93